MVYSLTEFYKFHSISYILHKYSDMICFLKLNEDASPMKNYNAKTSKHECFSMHGPKLA